MCKTLTGSEPLPVSKVVVAAAGIVHESAYAVGQIDTDFAGTNQVLPEMPSSMSPLASRSP